MRFNTVFVCVQTREYSRLVPYVRIQTHEPPQSIRRPPAPHVTVTPRSSGGTTHYTSAYSRTHRRTTSTMPSRWRQWAPDKSRASEASELARGSSSAHHICSASQAMQGSWARRPTKGRCVESARRSSARSRNASHRGSATWPRARLARGHRGPRRPFEGHLTGPLGRAG